MSQFSQVREPTVLSDWFITILGNLGLAKQMPASSWTTVLVKIKTIIFFGTMPRFALEHSVFISGCWPHLVLSRLVFWLG